MLQVLAGIDISILCAYIAVFSVSVLVDSFEILWLYVLWAHYVPYLNYFIRVVMLAASYLIVAATAERLIEVSGMDKGGTSNISPRSRYWTIALVLLFAALFRLNALWEIEL